MQKTGHKEEMIRRKRADKGNWKKHSWQCLTPEQSQPRKPPVADLGEEGARQEVIPEVREDKEVGASAEQVEITTQTSAIAAGSVDTGKLIVQRTQGQGLHSARLTERRGGRGGPQRCTASPQEIDSGATNSVLRTDSLPSAPKKSGRKSFTVGASGVPVLESCSVPLKCELDDQMIKHSFLVSENCPVNLMGRDLMCFFGIRLVSTEEGIKVLKRAELPLFQMMNYNPNPLLYAYEWELMLDHGAPKTHDLISFARTHSTAAGNYMQPLHCTSHVSVGPDRIYEEAWYDQQVETESLDLKHVYWSEEAAAVSVSLSPSQGKLFLGTTPHVSLAKPSHWKWQDLGPWLQQRINLLDFRPAAEDSRIEFSAIALHTQVKAALPSPATAIQHHLKPGDWVLIKDHRRKHWKQRRYTGPFQVLLTTETAVKVEGKATWVHASHCKRIPNPEGEGAAATGPD
ncbi:uncharacterized protein LOC130190746 isoform X2 [Pseudoliparis swirei]|uniref:uncharacterized protein LOC130190746 isoform X2 n=1 Tax=Pseudoliparis swirei TaxID=2059687 RepID=UPI0024BE5598|nr:uncharacterized protein LOC130190746 isoform X2 [Pseudoliparis swirei]